MSPGSIREYVAALRERYRRGGRKAKDRLLDEVAAVTGHHRKSAIRLLGPNHSPGRRRGRLGRPRVYGPAMAAAARVVWEACEQRGVKRLQPFVPELMDRLAACGELRLAPDVEALLRQVSASTLDRLLASARKGTTSRSR